MDPSDTDAFFAWQRRHRISQSRLRAGVIKLRQRELEQLVDGRLVKLPSKSSIANARKAYRALNRARQSTSMLNMPAPSGHVSLPRFPDDRSKALFAAHAKRRESGWTHG